MASIVATIALGAQVLDRETMLRHHSRCPIRLIEVEVIGCGFDVGGEIFAELREAAEEVEDGILGGCRAVSVQWGGRYRWFRSLEALPLFQSRGNFLRDCHTLRVSRDEVEGFRVSASLMLDDMCRDLQ